MELSDEVEVDENKVLPSTRLLIAKPEPRKGFHRIGRRASAVLSELEPISESNSPDTCNYTSKANLSLVDFGRSRPKQDHKDKLSHSFSFHSSAFNTSSCKSGLSSYSSGSNTFSSSSSTSVQITPPSELRKRIREETELSEYLKKELEELTEFTTLEKQVLSVEKGYEDLQMELKAVEEQHSSLKMEADEMARLVDSQKDLIEELTDKCKKAEEGQDVLKLELKAVEEQKTSLQNEIDEMNKVIISQKDLIEELTDKCKRAEEGPAQVKIDKDYEVLKQELKAVEEMKLSLQMEVEEMNKLIISQKDRIKGLTDKCERAEDELTQVKIHKGYEKFDLELKEVEEQKPSLQMEVDELNKLISSQKDLIAELTDKCKTAEEELSQFKINKEEQKTSLQNEVDELNKLINSQKDLIAELTNKCKRAEEELSQFKIDKEEQKTSSQNDVDEMNKLINSQKDLIEELTNKCKTAEEELSLFKIDKEEQKTSLQNEVDEMNKIINSQKAFIDELTDKCKTVEKELSLFKIDKEEQKSSLQNEVDEMNKIINSQKNLIDELTDKCKTAEDLIEELTDKYKRAEEELSLFKIDKEEQKTSLQNEVDEMNKIINSQKTLIDELTDKCKTVEEELSLFKIDKEDQKSSLQNEVDEMNKIINSQKNLIDELTDKCKTAEDLIEELTDKYKRAEEELSQVKIDKEELKSNLQMNVDELNKLINSQKDLIEELTDKCKRAEEELSQVKNGNEDQKTSLQNEVDELNKLINSQKDLIEELTDKCKRVEEELSQVKNGNEEQKTSLQNEVDEMTKLINSQKDLIEELTDKCKRAEEELSQVKNGNEEQKSSLQMEVDEMNKLIKSQNDQIKELTDKCKTAEEKLSQFKIDKEEQKSSLLMEVDEMNKVINSQNDIIDESTDRCKRTEEELSQFKIDKEEQKSIVQMEVDELNKLINSQKDLIEELADKCKRAEDELSRFKIDKEEQKSSLQNEVDKLNKLINSQKDLIEELTDKCKTAEEELSQLKIDKKSPCENEEICRQNLENFKLLKEQELKIEELQNIISLQGESLVDTELIGQGDQISSVNDENHQILSVGCEIDNTHDVSTYLEKIQALETELSHYKDPTSPQKIDDLSHSSLPEMNKSSDSVSSQKFDPLDEEKSQNSTFSPTAGGKVRLSEGMANVTVEDTSMTLSDSIGEYSMKKVPRTSNTYTPNQSTIGEYVELLGPQASPFDMTFNQNLERSILRSKLPASDITIYEQSHDPLSSDSEPARPMVDVPILRSMQLEEELNTLRQKYQSLNKTLEFKESTAKKSLALLDEIHNFLLPGDEFSDLDTLEKSEIALSLVREMLDTADDSIDFRKDGLIISFKNVITNNISLSEENASLKSTLDQFPVILDDLQLIKNDNSSLKTLASSLNEINLSCFEQPISQINEYLKEFTLMGENLKNLLTENKCLKEQLSELNSENSELKSTSTLYNDLLESYSRLKNTLEEKDKTLEEMMLLKTKLSAFFEEVKGLKVLGSAISYSFEGDFGILFQEVEKCLKDLNNSYITLENLAVQKETRAVESVCEKIASLLTHYNGLEQELDTLRKNCNEYLESNESLQSKITSLISENTSLKKDFDLLITEKDSLTTVIEEKSKLQQQVDGLLYSEKLLEEQSSGWKSKCSSLESKCDDLSSNINNLEAKIAQREELLTKYVSEKNELIEKIERLDENLKSKYQEYNSLVQEKEKCDELSMSLQSELKSAADNYTAEINDLKSRLANVISENESLKDSSGKYESELQQTKETKEDYLHALDNLSLMFELISNFPTYKNEIFTKPIRENTLSSSLKQILDFLVDFGGKYSEVEEQSFGWKTKCSELESKCEDLSCKIDDLEANIAQQEELITKYGSEKNDFIEKLNEIQTENEKMKSKLHDYDSLVQTKEKYGELEEQSFGWKTKCSELESKCEDLSCKIDDLEANIAQQEELITKYGSEKNDFIEKLNEIQTENEKMKSKLHDYDSLVQTKEKYLELSKSIENLESELKSTADKYTTEINDLKSRLANAISENEGLKEEMKISSGKYESEIQQAKETREDYLYALESLSSMCELISNFPNYKAEVECIKQIHDDTLSSSLKRISDYLIDFGEKYCEIEKSLAEETKQRDSLLSQVQDMSIIKSSLEERIKLFEYEIENILIILECAKTDDPNESWLLIKKKIEMYKNKADNSQKHESTVIADLENKVTYLESELLDTYNFKRKFSKELHGLKPEFKVHDLMSLSLEELQLQMLSTIMEKESAVVSNLERTYEMKLATQNDKIQQLEEEGKRKVDWIQEIESENDRLQNECKLIKEDNDHLKTDIKNKADIIVQLERQIENHKASVDSEIEKNEEDASETEKSIVEYSLQEIINELTHKLEVKSKEYNEAHASIQSKSEIIFKLEKKMEEIDIEKTRLKEEVKFLKEELNNQISNVENVTKKLNDVLAEREKIKLDESNSNSRTDDTNAYMFLAEFVTKFVKHADDVLKNDIVNSLEGNLMKVETANKNIQELKRQLDKQNTKYAELKSIEGDLSTLRIELEKYREINEEYEKFKTSSEDTSLKSIKNLENELENLRSQLKSLEVERDSLLISSNENQLLKEKVTSLEGLLSNANCKLASCKTENNELMKYKEEYPSLEQELQSLKQKYIECQKDSEKLNDIISEHSILKNKYEQCLLELEKSKDEVSCNNCVELRVKLSSTEEKIFSLEDELNKLNSEKKDKVGEILSTLEFERSRLKKAQLDLIQKENELLSLQKQLDVVMLESNKLKDSENSRIAALENKISEFTSHNAELTEQLSSLKSVLEDRNKTIEDINKNFHSSESCPFQKEASELKAKVAEYSVMLSQEREKFQLWKTNMEEDIRCKVLLISDLEEKLKKEVQNYKDAMFTNADLNKRVLEAEEKFKELEEKFNIHREVYRKEKSQLTMEANKKEVYEYKCNKIQKKCEEFCKNLSDLLKTSIPDLESGLAEISQLCSAYKEECEKGRQLDENYKHKYNEMQKQCDTVSQGINAFCDNLSNLLKKDIPDLKTASTEVAQLQSAFDEECEKGRLLDEECEELNNTIQHLEKQLNKLYADDIARNEKFNEDKALLEEEKRKNQNLAALLKTAEENLTSLKNQMKELDEEHQQEKNLYEVNIANLLEDKMKLLQVKREMETEILFLKKGTDQQKKQENNKMEELNREVNFLRLQIVEKNTKISNLEMRLEADGLPFQRRAEAAEKRVEELMKELKNSKIALNSRETIVCNASPFKVKACSDTEKKIRAFEETISRLQEENRKLQKDKHTLKKLAILRHQDIKQLRERLGIRGTEDLPDNNSEKM